MTVADLIAELRTPVPGLDALARRKRALVRLDTHPELVLLLEHHLAVLEHYRARGWA